MFQTPRILAVSTYRDYSGLFTTEAPTVEVASERVEKATPKEKTLTFLPE